VFSTNYQQKPRYAPPFTSSETNAKPLLEFYTEQDDTLSAMEEQHPFETSRFDHFSWPQEAEHPRRDEGRKPPQQNHFHDIHNSQQHVEQFQWQNLLHNGHFASDFGGPLANKPPVQGEPVFSDNIFQPGQANAQSNMDYRRNTSVDESLIQQTHGFPPNGHVKMEQLDQALDGMADQFGKYLYTEC
jgi:hypothetical protein